jgi:tRNA(His) 5'-end guanylyltransferase
VDGRAFHTITRKAEKPFDALIVSAMLDAAMAVAREMQGFKAGFIQSDEASFLLMDDDTIATEAWFDYNQQKLVSISAALMTISFNMSPDYTMYMLEKGLQGKSMRAVFDARAFSIPESEMANYFLWRAKDWERNSISMYARSFYSHKELHGLRRAEVLTKLEADGHRWNELAPHLRNGSWLSRELFCQGDILPNYDSVSNWLNQQLVVVEE